MKTITVKNDIGQDINAKVMTSDELYAAWQKIRPSASFAAWLNYLKEANIITLRELPRPDFIVLDIGCI